MQEMLKVTLLVLLSSSLSGDSEILIHKETEEKNTYGKLF